MAEKKTKVKQSGAQKRLLQAERRHMRNKAFKSRVRTSIRSCNETLNKETETPIKTDALKDVFSHLDKAAKKGIFHKNKTARLKSRIIAKSKSISK